MGTQSGEEDNGKLVGPLVVSAPTIRTDKFLAEEIWDREHDPVYLVYDFEKETIEKQESIDLGETRYDRKEDTFRKVIYRPVDNDMLRKGLVIVPRGVTSTDFKTVLKEIDEFAFECFDPCGQDDKVKLLIRIVLGSWFLDRFTKNPKNDIVGAGKFAPIIAIRSSSQSGKNRLSFVLRSISYRPFYDVSTARIPSLYRPMDIWKGVLTLDEADFANTDENSELSHYLNSRTYGTPILRVDPSNPKIMNCFENFQMTILTQRRIFDDNAIVSRSIPFDSEKTYRKIATVEKEQWIEKALELQDKLLYLRFKYFTKVDIDKAQWLDNISDPRLMSALLPLLALSKFEPEIYASIASTVKKIEEQKIKQKAMSQDGLIINFFWEKIDQEGGPLVDKWNDHYFFLDEIREEQGELQEDGKRKEPKITKMPLTTSIIGGMEGWSGKETRKAIDSFHLANPELPSKIRPPGSRRAINPIFFEPRKLEKALRDFVIGYKPGRIYEILGLATPTLQEYSTPHPCLDVEHSEHTEHASPFISDKKVPNVPHVPLPRAGGSPETGIKTGFPRVKVPCPSCGGEAEGDIYPGDDMATVMCGKCGVTHEIRKDLEGNWKTVNIPNHNGGR